MDRLSAEDSTFLFIEDDNHPMHVGVVTVWDGEPPEYGDLVRMMLSRLARVPRFRQTVRFVPLDLGRPVWVDDPHFQILYHVRHTALPSPGSQEQLRNLAGRVFAQHLDRTKPLWELWLVEGLERGRWALVWKIHHCMVDGISFMNIFTTLFDAGPDETTVPPPQPWRPRRAPSTMELLATAGTSVVTDGLEGMGKLAALLRDPNARRTPEQGRQRRQAALRIGDERTVSSLNGPIGPHRRWVWAEVGLDDAKRVGKALGGTVNDVILATVTRGFRELLLSRGEQLNGQVVRTLVPVSTRSQAEQKLFNNRVSGLFPSLPVSVSDPVDRLRLIHDQMSVLKASGTAGALDRAWAYVPPVLLSLNTRLGSQLPQRAIQTMTTNVTGSATPLYVLGRRMRYAYPYVPISGTVQMVIAIFSYAGGLFYGISGDYDSAQDIDILRWGITEGMSELMDLARPDAAGNGTQPEKVAASSKSAAR